MNATTLTATVINEKGAYKHLNGKTFEVVEHLGSRYVVLNIPVPWGGYKLVDFPQQNVVLNDQ